MAALAVGGFLRDSSPLIWPVLGLAAGGTWIFVREFFRLAVKREHRTTNLARGLRILPPLGIAIVVLGTLGAGLELHGLARVMAGPEGGSLERLLPGVGRAAEILTLSLVAFAALVPTTFYLYHLVRRIEPARAEWERRPGAGAGATRS